jgi:hypothetical protein
MDIRVAAIREDAMIGYGTCTYIDETFSDKELAVWLDEVNATTPKEAVVWARDFEELKLEQALNYRWGSDNDPQRIAYNEWQANLDKNPIRC